MPNGINTASAYNYRTQDPAAQRRQPVDQEGETTLASAPTTETETVTPRPAAVSDQQAKLNELTQVGSDGWDKVPAPEGVDVDSDVVWYSPKGEDKTILLSEPQQADDGSFYRDVIFYDGDGKPQLFERAVSGPTEDDTFIAALGNFEGANGGIGLKPEGDEQLRGGLTVVQDKSGNLILAQHDAQTGVITAATHIEPSARKIHTETYDENGEFATGHYYRLESDGRRAADRDYSGGTKILAGLWFSGKNDLGTALRSNQALREQYTALYNGNDEVFAQMREDYYANARLNREIQTEESQSIFANRQEQQEFALLQQRAELQNQRAENALEATNLTDAERERHEHTITRNNILLSLRGSNLENLDTEQTRELQEQLKASNPDITVDGKMGPETRAALQAALGAEELPDIIDTDYIAGVLETSQTSTVASDGAESETTTG